MVVHVSLTAVTKVGFSLCVVIRLELPLSTLRRVLSSLTLPNITGVLWTLCFPPVVTVNP